MLISEIMLLLLTIYTALVYGYVKHQSWCTFFIVCRSILYLLFSSVPLEMQQKRGIQTGVASLPFVAVFGELLFQLFKT